MPSKTGLEKNLRRYGLFLIIGLCITALIWGTMSAQLNTRALSFNEDAALPRPPHFGSAGWPSPANRQQLLVDGTQVCTVGAEVPARCVFHFFRSDALPLGGNRIRCGAGFRQLLKYHYGLYDRKGSGCGLLQLLDSPK